MKRSSILCAVVVCVATAVPPVHAIITRHDADTVVDKADAERFAAVGKILPDGEGVLIDPHWVLTAAHVATGPPKDRIRVRFAGIEYKVVEVVPYPGWGPGENDLALMRLSAQVRFVNPLDLHEARLAEGATVVVAGRGDHGDGLQGIAGNDGAMRVARNAVSRVEPDRLMITLDAPADGALPDEGISGPGDSGTPALIEVDGRLEVVGIGSVGQNPPKRRYGEYGSVDIFIGVSHVRKWIEETLGR